MVISLKEMFFEHADILVGICKDVSRYFYDNVLVSILRMCVCNYVV